MITLRALVVAVSRRRCTGLGLVALASSLTGCENDTVASKDDAGVAPRGDGGEGAPDAGAERRFTVATATLLPIDPAVPAQGTALFRVTRFGVDLELSIPTCGIPSPAPVEILEAGNCSESSLRASVWADGHGTGIPPANCAGGVSGFGSVRYERRGGHPDSWTVGDYAPSDLIGRAMVLRDGQSGQPRACGVIQRGEDVVWTPLPPPGDAPKVTVRALVAGLCVAKQFTSNATAGCPDAQALVQCSSAHCDVGRCLEACSDYTSCLDATEDPCTSSFACPQSDACLQCQSTLLSCTLGYCTEDLSCAPPVTPDGPCDKLLACCALQGEYASICLGVFQSQLAVAGDAGCIGAINDREQVGHLKDPCTFDLSAVSDHGRDTGAPMRDAGREPASERLADDIAGTPCRRDADCPGGLCAAGPKQPDSAGSQGFCTRSCATKSDCGLNGICMHDGNGGGRCLGSCGNDGACRAGFRCAGAVQLPVFGTPGACLPMQAVDRLGDNVAGRTCSDDADCPGGQCASRNLLGTKYPDNYCTARCYADGDCGAGGACLLPYGSFDAGYCLLACDTQKDCTRDGYRCWTLNDGVRILHACYPGADPLPDHSVGLPCKEQSACGAPQAQCAKEMPYGSFAIPEVASAPGGYCTQPCSLDEECGAGAQCLNVNTRGGLCMASCSDTAPCRDGYTCLQHLRDRDDAKVCVPVAPAATPTDGGL